MDGRQKFVSVAKMVLPELSGHIAERLEQFCDGGIFLLQAFRRARETNLGEASADGRLAGNKRGTPGGQLCCAYQSVKSAPSRARRSMLGVL